MALHSTTNDAGPYLVITDRPAGSTPEQIACTLDAAHAVFAEAAVDPVEAGCAEDVSEERAKFYGQLWQTAEQAATKACWAPRGGTPELTKIEIYFE